jgi:ABC-2 type transport system ATP-binding protein
MKHFIEIENLTKEYRGSSGWFRAVDGLNLTIEAGEVFAFLGRNGAGKTTTIKVLLGLAMPTSGNWRVLGGRIDDPKVRRRVGFLPEEHSFYPHLTVKEVLNFYGNLFGLRGADLSKAVASVIEIAGLQGRKKDRLKFLSKGLVQRVGLAQAMINDPDLLILDEPSSGLDPVGVQEFRDIVGRIKERDKTIFLNSHQLSEVEKLADRLGIIDKGKLVRTGRIEELLSGEGGVEVRITRPGDESLKSRLDGMAMRSWDDPDTGNFVLLMPDEDSVPEIMAVAREGGCKLVSVVPKRETLEQFFIETVKDGGGGDVK